MSNQIPQTEIDRIKGQTNLYATGSAELYEAVYRANYDGRLSEYLHRASPSPAAPEPEMAEAARPDDFNNWVSKWGNLLYDIGAGRNIREEFVSACDWLWEIMEEYILEHQRPDPSPISTPTSLGTEGGPYIDKDGITYSSEIVYKALQMEKDLAASLITGEPPEKKDTEPPADILEWINEKMFETHPYVYNDDAHLMKVDADRARGKAIAIAMWRKMQVERPASSNPEASYWFEKARTHLEDRNDFKAQLSRANERIASLEEEVEYTEAIYDGLVSDLNEKADKIARTLQPNYDPSQPETEAIKAMKDWAKRTCEEIASGKKEADIAIYNAAFHMAKHYWKIAEQAQEIASLTAERDEMRNTLVELEKVMRIDSKPHKLIESILKKYPQTKQA